MQAKKVNDGLFSFLESSLSPNGTFKIKYIMGLKMHLSLVEHDSDIFDIIHLISH